MADGAPTLSLSMAIPGFPTITAEIFANAFHTALFNTGGKLPPYFVGLLPESALRARLEATRNNPADRDDFGILAAAGEDLPGAVVIRPPKNSRDIPDYARTFGVATSADSLDMTVTEGATAGAASISVTTQSVALALLRHRAQHDLFHLFQHAFA